MLLSSSNTADYQEVIQYKNQFSAKIKSQLIVETEQEKHLNPMLGYTWDENTTRENIPIHEPVYVEKNEKGEDERIVYNSLSMEFGKRYEIPFKGEMWGLTKTEKDVDISKFYPAK